MTEAERLLKKISDTGILYQCDLALDAEVANYLARSEQSGGKTMTEAERLLRDVQSYLLEHDHEFLDENPDCAGCQLQERIAAHLARCEKHTGPSGDTPEEPKFADDSANVIYDGHEYESHAEAFIEYASDLRSLLVETQRRLREAREEKERWRVAYLGKEADLKVAERRPSAEGWIPVSERLPEYGQEVLLHISGDPYIRKGKCIDRIRKAWSAPTDGYPVLGQCHPSHWRPLPPPPTVGGKGEK